MPHDLGFSVGVNSEREREREHMWFQVCAATEDSPSLVHYGTLT